MKAFKMACLQYEPSGVDFENSSYTRNELIDAKNILLKYCLSQLKHLDLGVIDQKLQQERLDTAWANMQALQEAEDTDYAQLEPKNYPPYKEKEALEYPIDWLQADSIESARQNSQAINFHNTTNSRRHVMEPIRLSYPTSIKAPITHRGKKGRFADSQAFDQVISAQKSKLVGMKNHLR